VSDVIEDARSHQPDEDADDGGDEHEEEQPEAPADYCAVLLLALLAREP
jgi:hypothetical protein